MATAIGMFLLFFTLASYASSQTMRRIAGFGVVLDITVFIICFALFSGTGSERLGALWMSVGITFAIHTYRKLFGYEKYVVNRGWVRYAGVFTR